jgi:hypothetical protein
MKNYFAAVYDSEEKQKKEEKRSQRSKIFSSKISLLLKVKNSCVFFHLHDANIYSISPECKKIIVICLLCTQNRA